jgi:hypothetical protein
MFGGATHAADGRNATPNDTWAWIDRHWKLIKSSNAPPGRSFPAMAYDPVRQVVVMFGGGAANSDELRNDTWAWDGIDWKELHPTSSPGRGYLRMAYDPERRALLLVRQSNLSTDPVETWSWTGTTWILLASGSTPSPRWFSSLCNDPVTGEVLLVGGYSGPLGDPNANKSETFTWHNGAWLQKQTGQPSPSGNVAASLDEKRHQVVLFAASGNETWTFDGSRWTKRTPTHGPVPLLAFGALGYDFSTGMVLLFGGKTDSIPGSPYLNELWGWDGSDWIRLYAAPPPGSPSASTFAAADCVLPADGSDTSIGDFVVKTPAGWSKTTDVGPTETLMIRFTAPVAYTHSPTTVEIGGLIGMFDSAREGGQRYFSTDPASKNMFDCQVAGGTASFFTSSDAEQSVVRIFLLHQRLLYMVTLRGTGGLDPRAITDTKSLLGSWTWVSKMMSAGGA